jgi:hypothetical protein
MRTSHLHLLVRNCSLHVCTEQSAELDLLATVLNSDTDKVRTCL